MKTVRFFAFALTAGLALPATAAPGPGNQVNIGHNVVYRDNVTPHLRQPAPARPTPTQAKTQARTRTRIKAPKHEAQTYFLKAEKQRAKQQGLLERFKASHGKSTHLKGLAVGAGLKAGVAQARGLRALGAELSQLVSGERRAVMRNAWRAQSLYKTTKGHLLNGDMKAAEKTLQRADKAVATAERMIEKAQKSAAKKGASVAKDHQAAIGRSMMRQERYYESMAIAEQNGDYAGYMRAQRNVAQEQVNTLNYQRREMLAKAAGATGKKAKGLKSRAEQLLAKRRALEQKIREFDAQAQAPQAEADIGPQAESGVGPQPEASGARPTVRGMFGAMRAGQLEEAAGIHNALRAEGQGNWFQRTGALILKPFLLRQINKADAAKQRAAE